MGKVPALFPLSAGDQSTGWIASVLFHVILVSGALVFTKQITLAPQSPPFTWNVAMVESSSIHDHRSATVSSLESASTPETPTPSRLLSRKLSPQMTASSDRKPQPQSVAQSPTIPSLSASLSPSQDIQTSTSDVPTSSITTQSKPNEQVVQEPTVGGHVDSDSPISSRSVMTSSPHHVPESHSPPQNDEPSSLSPVLATQQSSVTQQTASENSTEKASASASEQQRIAMASVSSSSRPDYSWLSETILRRVQELKRYPAEARLDRAEGKVVLKAVVRGDGSVDDVEVYQSSGYQTLDHAAVELLKQSAPFQLPRPLGKPQMTVKIPMNYRLDQ